MGNHLLIQDWFMPRNVYIFINDTAKSCIHDTYVGCMCTTYNIYSWICWIHVLRYVSSFDNCFILLLVYICVNVVFSKLLIRPCTFGYINKTFDFDFVCMYTRVNKQKIRTTLCHCVLYKIYRQQKHKFCSSGSRDISTELHT